MATQQPSPTGYSLLGFLAWGPASGYDLRSLVERSVAYFWPVSHTQIYNELRRLVTLGLATEERVAQESRPDKRVYRITPAGRDAFRSWLARPMGGLTSRDPLLLKVFFADQLSSEDLDDELALREDAARRTRDELRDVVRSIGTGKGPGATAELGAEIADAYLRWIRRLRRRSPPFPTGRPPG